MLKFSNELKSMIYECGNSKKPIDPSKVMQAAEQLRKVQLKFDKVNKLSETEGTEEYKQGYQDALNLIKNILK